MTIAKRGMELLQAPSLNKSAAFTEAEKQAPLPSPTTLTPKRLRRCFWVRQTAPVSCPKSA